jgi:hypothetical protein
VGIDGSLKVDASHVARGFQRLFRSMNFVSRHPALNRSGPQATASPRRIQAGAAAIVAIQRSMRTADSTG